MSSTPTVGLEKLNLTSLLNRRVCRCGRLKSEGATLCAVCWSRLPHLIRGKLGSRKENLEDSYAEACRALDFYARKRTATAVQEGG